MGPFGDCTFDQWENQLLLSDAFARPYRTRYVIDIATFENDVVARQQQFLADMEAEGSCINPGTDGRDGNVADDVRWDGRARGVDGGVGGHGGG